MDLILWRHAEAVDPTPGMLDAQRRLTSKGEKQAARALPNEHNRRPMLWGGNSRPRSSLGLRARPMTCWNSFSGLWAKVVSSSLAINRPWVRHSTNSLASSKVSARSRRARFGGCAFVNAKPVTGPSWSRCSHQSFSSRRVRHQRIIEDANRL